LLLLLRDGRLEFGNCVLLSCDVPVFFQELIKQHRVHCFVTHSFFVSLHVLLSPERPIRTPSILLGIWGSKGSHRNVNTTDCFRYLIISAVISTKSF